MNSEKNCQGVWSHDSILLDTTYLLPLIGISIEELPDTLILELINRKYKIYTNYITLFELAAKGAKYITQGLLSSIRILKGINAIVYDDRIKKIGLEDTDVLATAFKLRVHVGDFIDCLIISTAIHYSNILLTEDETIIKLTNSTWFKELIKTLNPKLEVLNYRRFKERYMQ